MFKSKQHLMPPSGHFEVRLEDFNCHFLFLQHRNSSKLKLVEKKTLKTTRTQEMASELVLLVTGQLLGKYLDYSNTIRGSV